MAGTLKQADAIVTAGSDLSWQIIARAASLVYMTKGPQPSRVFYSKHEDSTPQEAQSPVAVSIDLKDRDPHEQDTRRTSTWCTDAAAHQHVQEVCRVLAQQRLHAVTGTQGPCATDSHPNGTHLPLQVSARCGPAASCAWSPAQGYPGRTPTAAADMEEPCWGRCSLVQSQMVLKLQSKLAHDND